jgi:hypothetical protein
MPNYEQVYELGFELHVTRSLEEPATGKMKEAANKTDVGVIRVLVIKSTVSKIVVR